ncbi:MAG TPA: hypothetical protein VFK50_03825 [Sphingomicrobium sp.]|nr:hypothetical protein [Sphingomicrobium sp.]
MMIATVLLGLASIAAQGAGAAPPAAGEVITKEQAEERLAKCGSRKFESVAEFQVDGKMKRSRLTLCAAESDSAEEWIATLEKNESAIKAQSRLPESARFKLLSDLRAEIDRLKGGQGIVAVKGDLIAVKGDLGIGAKPKSEVTVPKSDFAVSTLPAMPVAKTVVSRAFDPKKAATPLTRRPQLAIKCLNPGGAAARCSFMAVDTAIEIEAEEDLASAVTLHFRRTDSNREGEVRLAQLKRGDTVRLRVPPEICKGVVRAEFDVQVSGAGSGGLRYSDVVGPFEKRC